MQSVPRLLVPLFVLTLAGPARAEEASNFVVQLGVDTTSVEHFTRTASRIVVDEVGRSPSVMRRHLEFELANGAVTKAHVVASRPGSSTPIQTLEVTCEPDSIRVEMHNPNGATQHVTVAAPAGTLPIAGTCPWEAYETATMRFAGTKADSLAVPIYFLGFPAPDRLLLQRVGRDSVQLSIRDHEDVFRLRVDRAGRILGARPIAGTGKVSATRVPSANVDAFATAFAAREKQGAGLGILSPRDTVQVADVGGASIWVDYSRPARRGRVIFGEVVPWGQVWRTGANAATQFSTNRPLQVGQTTVPAGKYTLWTVPSPTGWKLLVNSQTGQWGTDHDASKDVYTFDMGVETLPDPVERFTIHVVPRTGGGVLQLDWDTTRASLEFQTAGAAQ